MSVNLVRINLFENKKYKSRVTSFRARDKYSVSDRRECLRVNSGEGIEFPFSIKGKIKPGVYEIILSGMLEIFDSYVYVHRAINSVIEISVNGVSIFNGVIHWRSHEETAAYWQVFDFSFDSGVLREGKNAITFRNRTNKKTLGEFYDDEFTKVLGEKEAIRKLSTLLISGIEVNFAREYEKYPHIAGVPDSAISAKPVVIEVNTGQVRENVSCVKSENAVVADLGCQKEFGCYRHLFEVAPGKSGKSVRISFQVGNEILYCKITNVYKDAKEQPLFAGPGAETTYWHQLKRALIDVYEKRTGNTIRVSIDDFLANLHFVPKKKWKEFVGYIVRRKLHYAFQRIRVPKYTRVADSDLKELADMGRGLFVGRSIAEPHHALFSAISQEKDNKKRIELYLDRFKRMMTEQRLKGHPLVTFDCASPLCGHYYKLGLDVHLEEVGPVCNCLSETGCRGGATAYGKQWGVACAMHWYCGQGAHYCYDESRVRFAWLTMIASYLAGARQILWEGGMFDNLPVYNFALTEESWRDYFRRYDDAHLISARDCFRKLVEFHNEHQLPSPTVRLGIIRGTNDIFTGSFDGNASFFGDMSMARAWSLISVFLPDVSFGRGGQEHGRKAKRWYSSTPYGQVDIIPAEANAEFFSKYRLLSMLGWNTMTGELYAKLVEYVKNGGVLFISLPHFAVDTIQKLEWNFYNNGDLTKLCGVKVGEIGGRIEEVKFRTKIFSKYIPEKYVLSEKNPLYIEDYDEKYPAFSIDVAYLCGEMKVIDAEVLAVNQKNEPALIRKKLGKGEVYLLNTWYYPGLGRMQDVAKAILKTLADRVELPIQIHDKSGKISWYEYKTKTGTKFFLLNTDWTKPGNIAQVTVTANGKTRKLEVQEGKPVEFDI